MAGCELTLVHRRRLRHERERGESEAIQLRLRRAGAPLWGRGGARRDSGGTRVGVDVDVRNSIREVERLAQLLGVTLLEQRQNLRE